MTGLWVLIVSRALICLAAGEICIRYAAWSILLARSGERLVAAPLVFGVAMWSLARFGVEGRWLTLMALPPNAARIVSATEGDIFSEVMRVLLFVALCFMTYPVTKIQYRHSWERALVELAVRIFLIGVSALAGWVLSTVHLVHAAH